MKLSKIISSCGLIAIASSANITTIAADALDSWTTNGIGSQDYIGSIAFGNRQFVGVGADASGNFTGAAVVTSPDSFTWTRRSSGVTNNQTLGGITFGNGQFLAVGGQGNLRYPFSAAIVTSADGISWTVQNLDVTNAFLTSVVFANGQFVAVGRVGSPKFTAAAFSSTDGVNWTPWYWTSGSSGGDPSTFVKVAYGNGLFVALGSAGDLAPPLATSTDGVNWTQHSIGLLGRGIQVLTFGNNLFIAAGGYTETVSSPDFGNQTINHATIWSSPDGVSWTKRQDYTNEIGAPFVVNPGRSFSIADYGAGIFVVAGATSDAANDKPLLHASLDGVNWVLHDLPAKLTAIAFGGGRFLGLGSGFAAQSGVIGKLGANLAPRGILHGTVTGVSGQAFAIQTSTDLNHWGLLRNVTVATNGLGQFTDQISSMLPRRFYEGSAVTSQ